MANHRWTRQFFMASLALCCWSTALFSSDFHHNTSTTGASPLIDIHQLAPNILIEMRYATTDNFTKTKLYDVPQCLLCEPIAHRLARVQQSLEKKGLGLKVWDCYRPVSVQKKLWAVVPDARYVANPKTGSKHNRGASVDLTLVDRLGKELPMPTAFDEFSEKAHRNYMDLPAEALKNRKILQDAMEAEGFIGNPTEWWHFDGPEWMHYALRDEPLGDPRLMEDLKATIKHTPVPAHAKQLLIVLSDQWPSKHATLQRYERKNDAWVAVDQPWPVMLGSTGMAWGVGLHTVADNGRLKKEGDHSTTAGLFRLGTAYGRSPHAPEGSRWPYQMIDENWVCVDDPGSRSYNRVLRKTSTTDVDWQSAEEMKRNDHLYDWVINIEQNTPDAIPGRGSCVFLHVWRAHTSPTEGCVALEEFHIKQLLQWLDPAAAPHIVILPRERYEALKKDWQLP